MALASRSKGRAQCEFGIVKNQRLTKKRIFVFHQNCGTVSPIVPTSKSPCIAISATS